MSRIPPHRVRKALIALCHSGQKGLTVSELFDAMYADDPTGGPTRGVTDAVSDLRAAGHDVGRETTFVLPPRSRRPPLASPLHRRIVEAIEAGYDDPDSLAAYLGCPPKRVLSEVARIRMRGRWQLETRQGYRLYRDCDQLAA